MKKIKHRTGRMPNFIGVFNPLAAAQERYRHQSTWINGGDNREWCFVCKEHDHNDNHCWSECHGSH